MIRAAARSWLLPLALAAGCSDANLYSVGSQPNIANRISLEGELCTDDPSAVDFPVKVLVVIDGTADIVMNDPNANRAGMLETLVARYNTPNYSFGFIQFSGEARDLTGGYATDTSTIQPAIDTIGIGTEDAARNYLDALRAAATTVEDDILSSTPGVRSRTRYVVLWVAAGPPNPALQTAWCMGNGYDPTKPACQTAFTAAFCADIQPVPADCELALYQQNAADLSSYVVSHGAQGLTFDTFALTTDQRTNDLLTAMATATQGSFAQQLPDSLNLLKVDISASTSVLLERGFVVYNPTMMLRAGHPVPDSDGDGLPDDEELMLGTDPTRADTDGDNVGDGIEVRLAAPGLQFDPLVPHVPDACLGIDPPDLDSDSDGLLDCEEAVLRTDPSLVDTDKDGLPDQLEWNRGSDPLVDDLLVDSDHDGIPNGQEVSEGLSALDGDAQYELDYGYRYSLVQENMGNPVTQLEAVPHDPMPGVLTLTIAGSTAAVGSIVLKPGPPATLAWADDVQKLNYGPAIDVSRGGQFTLVSGDTGRALDVNVTPAELPQLAAGAKDEQQILVRPTVRTCFHFDVRNISLTSPLALPGGRPGAGWNPIQVFLGELPQAAPNGYLIYDLATVPVRFNSVTNTKSPNVPYITLDQYSFVLLEGTP